MENTQKMKRPQAIKDEAKEWLEYGARVHHIGKYKGYEVYSVDFPDGMITGYPIILLYKEGEPVLELQYEAERFFGDSVFDIMRIAAKNTRDRQKAARLEKKQSI